MISVKTPHPFDDNLKHVFVAGGALLSMATKSPVADYDLYLKNSKYLLEVVEYIRECGGYVIKFSNNAITFKLNEKNDKGERILVQLMYFKDFETAKDIFEVFDFSVCMAAFDCDTKKYHYGDTFWQDAASRTIRFNPKTRYPLNSMIRTIKYREKGFKFGKGEMTKIALAVAERGIPKTWDELTDAIGGTYGKELRFRIDEDKTEFDLEHAYEILSDFEFNTTQVDPKEDKVVNFLNSSERGMLEYLMDDTLSFYNIDNENILVVKNIRNGLMKLSFVHDIISVKELDTSMEILTIMERDVKITVIDDPNFNVFGIKSAKKCDDHFIPPVKNMNDVKYIIYRQIEIPGNGSYFHKIQTTYNLNQKLWSIKENESSYIVCDFAIKDMKVRNTNEFTVSKLTPVMELNLDKETKYAYTLVNV